MGDEYRGHDRVFRVAVGLGARADAAPTVISRVHLLGRDDFAGVRIKVLELLHIAQANLVTHLRPVRALLRVAVVVGHINRRDRVGGGVGERGQVALQHFEFGKREILHAIKLDAVGQQAVFVALLIRDHEVERFWRVPLPPALAEPVLGDELLHVRHLAVDAARVRDAALCVDVRNDVFLHRLIGRGKACAGLEVGRVADDEIDRRLA